MALKGIRVLELAGLAPVPFCGMILADFGASVVRVDRIVPGMLGGDFGRGKRSIAVNLKDLKGQQVVQKLASKADVIIEPFRPGVMEKLNLGPDKLLAANPGLVYARISGYGQTGPLALKAGHDINYVAMSGVLSMLGRKDEKPTPPVNLLADFAGGGLSCALGIVMSLLERTKSGKGQVVDMSMVEGAAYVSSFIFKTQDLALWGKRRGTNWLDSGAHFYDTYETKDNKFMAVGALEPQFYRDFMIGLGLSDDKAIEQLSDFDESKQKITQIFKTKTQDEWVKAYEKLDACVTPVLDLEEAPHHPLNSERNSFTQNETNGRWEPHPAPKLSRTPGSAPRKCKDAGVGEHTIDVLKENGYSMEEIKQLLDSSVIGIVEGSKL